jgi:hypothetical protein
MKTVLAECVRSGCRIRSGMLGTDDNAGRGPRHREIRLGISLARILIRDRSRHSHLDDGIAAAHAVARGGTREVTVERVGEFSFENPRKLTSEHHSNGSNFDTVSRRGITLATRGLDVR